MTQRSLYGVNPRPPAPAPAPASVGNAILGALFLGFLFTALWILTGLAGGGADAPTGRTAFVAYYPDVRSARVGTDVLVANQKVGRIDSVTHGVVGVQLEVYPGRVPEVPELRTVTSDEPLVVPVSNVRVGLNASAFDAGLDLTWSANGRVTRLFLRYQRDGSWVVPGNPESTQVLVPALFVNRRVRPISTGDTLRPGDLLMLGTTGLQLNRLQRLTRVDLSIDEAAYRKQIGGLIGDSLGTERTIGPGSILAMGNALGLGAASADLRPSYSAPDRRIRPATVPELQPEASGDPLEILSQMTDYLNSPSALNAPPNNRFQQLVADLNATLTEIRGTVNVLKSQAEIDAGAGAVGRLVFDGDAFRSLSEILDTLQRAAGDAAGTLQDVRRSASGEVPGVVGNLVFGDGGDALDLAISEVAQAAAEGELLNLLLDADQEGELSEIMVNLRKLTSHVQRMSKDLATGNRNALGIVLGDKEAQDLLKQLMTQLDGVGDTARTVGLGVVGLVLVEILSGLFF